MPVTLTTQDGFELVTLTSDAVRLSVVPTLGAKVCSLTDLRTGREWMWSPPGPRRFFTSEFGSPFPDSTLIGADECLPTIGACTWNGRHLPDHGEVWSVPWALDRTALASDAIVTTVDLAVSPLRLRRRITLSGATVTFAYAVTNLGEAPEEFLWAFHPLLTYVEGDRAEFPPGTGRLLMECASFANGRGTLPSVRPSPGIDLEGLSIAGGSGYAKVFAGPVTTGSAAIVGSGRDRLAYTWDARELPWFGFWLTRGGWLGHHHPAPEPTTSGCDRLDQAVAERLGHRHVEAGAVSTWSFTLTLGR